ncbi:iron ABC transporter permease [Actinocorallia sp. A-T 12471]|uniref:FecCD family ABC transporter permease n=1 Tax=Actinocorallia sp. A-T 12471 TaxID=3089813 RepID=UPI0029CBAE0E|nr:iron ABC transporter permease [Actinocorallia sp. A-T 12471]MDX6741208.1 iron ABC transporter permease [Actinocorallia sp. A-T 12471]
MTRGIRGVLLLTGAAAVLLCGCLLSLAFGALSIPPGDVVAVLTGRQDGTRFADVLWSVRVPRTLLGLATGAALGVAGALMQALTRNPLADPGILGVSAGASFAIVVSAGLLGVTSLSGYIWPAFLGALLASVAVYALGGVGAFGQTPVKLALAGVAVTALLGSLTHGIVLTDPDALDRFRFWSAGSLAGVGADELLWITPFLVFGGFLALACAPALNSLALGDDVAASLGRSPWLVRAQGTAAITLLTGASVAVIGPVVFLGLVVPHLARVLTQRVGIGPDHRWLLPLSGLIAPALLLAADVVGRIVVRPVEIQSGVIVALLGGPFFIVLVRRARLREI